MDWWITRRAAQSGEGTASVSCLIRSSTVESKSSLLREHQGKAGPGRRGARPPGGRCHDCRAQDSPADAGRRLGGCAGRGQAAARRGEPGHGAAGGRDQGGRRGGFFSSSDRRMKISVQKEDFDLGAEVKAISANPKIGAVASL